MSPEERTDTISRKDSDFNLGIEGPVTELASRSAGAASGQAGGAT